MDRSLVSLSPVQLFGVLGSGFGGGLGGGVMGDGGRGGG